MTPILRIVLGMALAAGICLPAQAAFITVDTLDNEDNSDGDCSLREALRAANDNTAADNCVAGSGTGTDSIYVAVAGIIAVNQAMLVTERVTIFALGMNTLTLDAHSSSQIFIVDMPDDSHDFKLSLMTLKNAGDALPGGAVWLKRGGAFTFEGIRFADNASNGSQGKGGAIATTLPRHDASTLTIKRCVFSGNQTSGTGGALAIQGFPAAEPVTHLNISESTFSDNSSTGSGGAIYSDDVTTSINIDHSRFDGNDSGKAGGAILVQAPDSTALAYITASTFAENHASTDGGALSVHDGVILIDNSSFSKNISDTSFGNAISARFSAVVAMFHNSLINNDYKNRVIDKALSISDGASLSMGHSIVYSPASSAEQECHVQAGNGTYNSLGFNIDTSGTCTSEATDQPMTDPQLMTLADNGDGSSYVELLSFLPRPGSPAVDGGKTGPCKTVFGASLGEDERGQPRPASGSGDRCDIGAVEFQAADDVIFRHGFE